MAVTCNGKVYRNIQQQVQKNKEDIDAIKNAGVIGYEAGSGIEIDEGVISVDTDVIQSKLTPNPTDSATAQLGKLKIDGTVYNFAGGGGGGTYIAGDGITISAENQISIDEEVTATVEYVDESVTGLVTQSEVEDTIAEKIVANPTETTATLTGIKIGDTSYAVSGGTGGGVSDVKVNNVSCVTNNVANIPLANGANYGVTKGTIPTNAQLAIVGITNNGTAYYAEAEGTLDANVSDQWKAIKVVNSGAMVTKNVPRVSTTAAPSGAEVLSSVYVGDTQYALPTGGGSSTVIHAGNGIDVTAASDGYNVAAKANSSNNGILVTSDGIGANFNAVQAKLTAGANISISGATISATDTVSSIDALNASISITGRAPSQTVAVNFKPNGGLSYDSNGCYVTDAPSCNGLTFEVVQSQPTSPVANRIYFILS